MSDVALLVLNGPGLARLGDFADDACGVNSLDQVRRACEQLGSELGVRIDFRQTDDTDELTRWIRNDVNQFDALIINQLGCVDTSPVDYPTYRKQMEILATLSVPVTEVHMTNVLRDDPDRFSALRGPAGKTAMICGLGLDSYRVAIRAAAGAAVGSAAP